MGLERASASGATLNRAPRLEALLARADSSAESEAWRADAFRVVSADPLPAIGAAGLLATGGPDPEACACAYVATPVYYEAAMTYVRMPPHGVISLTAAAAAELAADFNRVFRDGGQRLQAARDGALYCTFARPIEAQTADPMRVAGRDIGPWLPTGGQSAALRALMSEIEMWLFDHPLNQRRAAQRVVALGRWAANAGFAEHPWLGCGARCAVFGLGRRDFRSAHGRRRCDTRRAAGHA
jgi:hypothetical protein